MASGEAKGIRPKSSLMELLIQFFDRQVETLMAESVPPDRIAAALKIATVRVAILYDAPGQNLRLLSELASPMQAPGGRPSAPVPTEQTGF